MVDGDKDLNDSKNAQLILRKRSRLLFLGLLLVGLYAVSTVVGAATLAGFWTPWSIAALVLCVVVGLVLAVVRAANDSLMRKLELTPGKNLAAGVFALSLLTTLFVGMGVDSYVVAAQPTRSVDVYVTGCSHGGRGDAACRGRWNVDGQSFEGRIPFEPEPGTTQRLDVVAAHPE